MAFAYDKELLNKGLSYSAYRKVINDILAEPPQDDDAAKMRPYIIDNVAIMDTYGHDARVANGVKAALEAAPAATWLVITEGWCGDAAFNLPILAALEQAVPDKMKMCIFLRDSNLELMDANLTDGGRSIPIVVVLSEELKVLGKWGPRPAGLQLLMKEWKNQGLILKDIITKVKEWYDADNTASVQEELAALIETYSRTADTTNIINR